MLCRLVRMFLLLFDILSHYELSYGKEMQIQLLNCSALGEKYCSCSLINKCIIKTFIYISVLIMQKCLHVLLTENTLHSDLHLFNYKTLKHRQ